MQVSNFGPVRRIETITLDAAMEPCDGIYIGVGGNISIVDESGTTRVIVGVVAGTVYPFKATKVNTTGTTATDYWALYCTPGVAS
jgi:hypothetical protein